MARAGIASAEITHENQVRSRAGTLSLRSCRRNPMGHFSPAAAASEYVRMIKKR